MATSGYIDCFDGTEIAVTIDGIKLYGLDKLGWKASQKKEFKRGIGLRKRGEPANSGKDVIGVSRGPVEFTWDAEITEVNNALLEPVVNAARAGETELDEFSINGQTARCLHDLRNLEIVITYPAINGVRRKPKFLDVEFTEDSGEIKHGETPGRKVSGIAAGAEGLV
jgi:hypothetical protein